MPLPTPTAGRQARAQLRTRNKDMFHFLQTMVRRKVHVVVRGGARHPVRVEAHVWLPHEARERVGKKLHVCRGR